VMEMTSRIDDRSGWLVGGCYAARTAGVTGRAARRGPRRSSRHAGLAVAPTPAEADSRPRTRSASGTPATLGPAAITAIRPALRPWMDHSPEPCRPAGRTAVDDRLVAFMAKRIVSLSTFWSRPPPIPNAILSTANPASSTR